MDLLISVTKNTQKNKKIFFQTWNLPHRKSFQDVRTKKNFTNYLTDPHVIHRLTDDFWKKIPNQITLMVSSLKKLVFIEFVRFESKRVKFSTYGDETHSIKFFSKKNLKKKWRTENIHNFIPMKFGTLTHRLINLWELFQIQNEKVFNQGKSTPNWSYFMENPLQIGKYNFGIFFSKSRL